MRIIKKKDKRAAKIEFRSMFARKFDFHSTMLIASSDKETERTRKLIGNSIQIDRKRNNIHCFFLIQFTIF